MNDLPSGGFVKVMPLDEYKALLADVREGQVARDARQALEECLFDGPVPDDGSLVYQRAVELRKAEAELAAAKAERDEALRQNAEAAPLMDAYRDLVVAWHAYDKTQPAQGLFEQLETITNRVALNNAGVAFLKKYEVLEAERDKLRDELQYARCFSVEKFEALEAERDALRAALEQVRTFLLKEDELYRDQMEKSAMPRGPLGDELLRMLDVTRAALDEGGA